MDKHIGLGVQIIVKNDKGEFYLAKRSKEFGFGEWEMPGGHLEFGETFEEGVARECKEELGIDVNVGKLLSVSTNMRQGNHYIIFTFEVESYTGVPENKEPDVHSEWGWFSKENLPEKLFTSTKDGLENYFAGVMYTPLVRQQS